MLQQQNIATAIAATATGAAVTMNTTPFVPGTSVIARITPVGFSGTPILQGSDDNASWSSLFAPGAMTTDDAPVQVQVTLPKYVRHNTTRSAGTVSYDIVSGS